MSFDWLIYRELNPDLKENGLISREQVIKHYLDCGIKEKRQFNLYKVYPDFNCTIYRNNYKDLQHMTKLELERHWVEYGKNEKRTYKLKTNNKTIVPKVPKVPNISKSTNVSNITFIVPTIGRSTLIRTIISIKNQTKPNWKCIIIFDGINTPMNITNLVKSDKRFTILKTQKVGTLNHGARVRNEGLKLVKNGWVGFVDDDDAISPYYVEHMNNYLSVPNNVQCVIFRMMYSDNNVIPKINSPNFYEGNVGISFCYNSELLKKGFYFTPSGCEDYVLLNKIRSYRLKIVMSSKIGYLVRPQSNINTEYMKSLKQIENSMSDLIIN
jgi:hypothetical protein